MYYKIYILDQYSHHIETSQLICSPNQLAGFYMMGTLVVKGLKALRNSQDTSSHRRCRVKKYVFKMLQTSHEITCVDVSF